MSKNLGWNNFFYNYFLNNKLLKVRDELSEDELVRRIAHLAHFAWNNHSGFYYDGRIENILVDYGRNLDKLVDSNRVGDAIGRLRLADETCTLLHVATRLYDVGGHTRVLYELLKRQLDKKQILVLTAQSLETVPELFTNSFKNKLRIVTLDSLDSLFERSYVLRYISKRSKTTILYHHPDDVVPTIALSDEECPPVLLENHAHSWFWLGASVVDLLFTHTVFHKEFTLKTRPLDNVYLLPMAQIDNLGTTCDREEKIRAKEKMGIALDAVCIIAVGTAAKFIPNADYDFFKTAKKIVERFKNARIYVIGVSERPQLRKKYNLDAQTIHLVGPVTDPTDYYKAADITLDALPQPSLGAVYVSTVMGMCCPLLKYGATNVFNSNNVIQSNLYKKYIGSPKNEEEYLEKLGMLISNPDIRFEIASEIREEAIRRHSNDRVTERINEMLELAKDLKHRPRMIPDGVYHLDDDSAEIASASRDQDLYKVHSNFGDYLNIKDEIVILLLLLTKFIYFTDILKFTSTVLKNRIRRLYSILRRQVRSSPG